MDFTCERLILQHPGDVGDAANHFCGANISINPMGVTNVEILELEFLGHTNCCQ